MKIEEAIEFFKIRQQWLSDDEDTANIEGRFKGAQICRDQMSWFDDAIEVLEKQVPKSPVLKVNQKYKQLGKNYYCQCGVMFASWEIEGGQTNYCGNCGQRLKR